MLEKQRQDQDATTLIKLSKQLYEFSNLISFNRGDEIIIGKQSEQIKALLEKQMPNISVRWGPCLNRSRNLLEILIPIVPKI